MNNKGVKIKKVFLRTYGCQMNLRDSEIICGILKKEGYNITEEPGKADIVLFNTCSVRQHAEDKVWSEIGRIAKRRMRDEGRGTSENPLIGLVGCMAQNYKEQIFKRAPQVDFVVGPGDIAKIPEIIKKIRSQKSEVRSKALFELRVWETGAEPRPEEIYHTGFYTEREHAYVVISEGCSNFCSYCVVPYVRGQLLSRNSEDILQEIKEAVDKGITKITLLGQNVCAYGADDRKQRTEKRESISFIKLLEAVNKIEGLRDFSFITSHPKDATIELFKAMQDLEKLKKYLHLPVQSGSDRVLKIMNRGYTRKFYLELVDNYRKIVKDGVLTTDIIVGFPTETEDDFQDSHNLVKETEFNAAYIFKYSPRLHTDAAKIPDDVAKEEKEKRHRIMLEFQKSISRKRKVQSVNGSLLCAENEF